MKRIFRLRHPETTALVDMDYLLPNRRDWSAEQRLQAAVLERALLDALGLGLEATAPAHGAEACQVARAWIDGAPTEVEAFAFEHVCESLGLDPGAVRSRLATGHLEPPRRLEAWTRRDTKVTPECCNSLENGG